MPRLPIPLLIQAHSQNPLLTLLLRECRDLPSSRNELRWLKEHAVSLAGASSSSSSSSSSLSSTKTTGPRQKRRYPFTNKNPNIGWRTRLRRLCEKRARGVPLQYLIGNQPFGDLEILCQPGVLIPRSETESYTHHIASQIISKYASSFPPQGKQQQNQQLRILDLCTGTGCIPLLLHALLYRKFPNLSITGIDISPVALRLARRNRAHNVQLGHLTPAAMSQVSFLRADVLDGVASSLGKESIEDYVPSIDELLLDQQTSASSSSSSSTATTKTTTTTTHPKFHILTSNPPYISRAEFTNGTTSRSVRRFEPSLALVPPPLLKLSSSNPTSNPSPTNIDDDGDIFYPRLLSQAERVDAGIVVLECGSLAQAERIVQMVRNDMKDAGEWKVEIWGLESGTEGAKAVILVR